MSDRVERADEVYEMLSQLPAAVIVRRGPDLRCVFQNPAGIALGDHRGKTLRESFSDQADAWRAKYEYVMQSGTTLDERELALPAAGGGVRYFDVSWAPWQTPGGTTDGVVMISFEVTDRVKARRRAEEADERRRLALDAANVGTWRIDLTTKLGTRDAALNRILGFEDVETTQSIEDFVSRVHPDDRARVLAAIRASITTGADYDAEARIVRPDGSVRWLRDLGRVVRDDDGTPITFTGAAADITERKLAQERSDLAYQRLGAALAASQIGTYFWDVRTDRVECDVGVERLLGGALDPARPIADFASRVHEEDRAELLAAMDASSRGGADFHQEYRVVTGSGVRWVLDTGKMVHDAAGPAYMIGALVDITEQKRLAEAALAASHAKDEFLAMLGHELRNPLAPIVTALDIMKLRGDPATKERKTIERQVMHLIRLVDDLLDISRVTRGMIELKRERVSIRDVINKAVEIASPLIEQKQHHIAVEVPGALWVDGDPVRLAQVFANLLTNAARYTNDRGVIDVVASREHDRVCVRVSDNGIGIEPDLLARVFDLFVQGGHRNPARSEGGLGIGLALVKNLIAMHGGNVHAHSNGPGCGSTFVVELQAVGAEESVRTGPVPPSPLELASGRRILVVDDNADAAGLLGEALRTFGHEVVVAYDGPQALTLVENFRPDAAVLDIGLPVMDGYELARRLRDERGLASCVLVALTGYGQEQDRARSMEAGFNAHMVKPVDLKRLVQVLERDSR